MLSSGFGLIFRGFFLPLSWAPPLVPVLLFLFCGVFGGGEWSWPPEVFLAASSILAWGGCIVVDMACYAGDRFAMMSTVIMLTSSRTPRGHPGGSQVFAPVYAGVP